LAEDPPQVDILSLLLGGVIGVALSDLVNLLVFGEPIVIPTAIEYMLGMYSSIRERFRRVSARVPK